MRAGGLCAGGGAGGDREGLTDPRGGGVPSEPRMFFVCRSVQKSYYKGRTICIDKLPLGKLHSTYPVISSGIEFMVSIGHELTFPGLTTAETRCCQQRSRRQWD